MPQNRGRTTNRAWNRDRGRAKGPAAGYPARARSALSALLRPKPAAAPNSDVVVKVPSPLLCSRVAASSPFWSTFLVFRFFFLSYFSLFSLLLGFFLAEVRGTRLFSLTWPSFLSSYLSICPYFCARLLRLVSPLLTADDTLPTAPAPPFAFAFRVAFVSLPCWSRRPSACLSVRLLHY